VADALAMTRVFIHPHAGVLSAYGMGLADQVAMRSRAGEARLGGLRARESARAAGDRSAQTSWSAGRAGGKGARRTAPRTSSTEGTDTALVVPARPAAEMLRQFEEATASSFRSSHAQEGR
jgi:5-oxoprolinase (ATP-hydrolysing)